VFPGNVRLYVSTHVITWTIISTNGIDEILRLIRKSLITNIHVCLDQQARLQNTSLSDKYSGCGFANMTEKSQEIVRHGIFKTEIIQDRPTPQAIA
jgi:hypothetical protein